MTQLIPPVLVYYHERMLEHNPHGWDPNHPEWTDAVKAMIATHYPDSRLNTYEHPERPERLTVIADRLAAQYIQGTLWVRPEPAEASELMRAHTDRHVARIEGMAGKSGWLAKDTTAVSPGSVAAAKLAAGAGINAVEAVARGEARRAFCVVRPPGHHAPADQAMGFCLYNNIAVAAAHARAALGYERVMIWDWDMHHGNGTQDIFYSDPNVLVIDSHCAAPFYPGTGFLEETGAGSGMGYNLNVPMPPGSGNATLHDIFNQIVWPAAAAFRPDIILVSAGFDCHYLDMTCAMDETGYTEIAQRMCVLTDQICGGRLVMMLEGGYNAHALSASVDAVIRAMAGSAPVAAINVLPADVGRAAVAEAAAFHADSIKALGR